MKTFVFRLERLLQLRATTEKERARSLGVALRDAQSRRDALSIAEERLGRCGDQVAHSAATVTTAGALNNLKLTVKAAEKDVEAAEVSHRAAQSAVDTETEKFGHARKDKRVVERLREKRHEAWQLEASRQEQRDLDGIAQHRRAADRRP